MRKIAVLIISVSVFALSATASAFYSDLDQGQQFKLIKLMNTPVVNEPVFVPQHPAEAPVNPGVPPVLSEGITSKVEARCNSPGYRNPL